jgi:hypothetical protein
MSTNVPNPFWLFDQFVLDRLFNPVTWWSDYHFGKDAMDLRFGFTALGYLLLVFSAVNSRAFIFLFFLLILMSLIWLFRDTPRRQWVKNNKTGRNIRRVEGFTLRMFNQALLAYISMPTPADTRSSLDYWVTFAGFICLIVIGEYLDATDILPPHYHERKITPQFT